MGEPIKPNFFDRVVGYFAPGVAARNLAHRALSRDIAASYGGAVPTRADTVWSGAVENPVVANAGLAHGSLKSLRDRGRQLRQNNPLASGMLERAVENVVGDHGYALHAKTEDKDWNKKAEALFAGWLDSADVLGNCWLEHLRFVVRHWLGDGDFGSVLLQEGRLQPLDPASINTPFDKLGDPFYVDGVQVNDFGRPIAYYVDQWKGYARLPGSTQIAAENVLFIARKKTVNQTRGEPCFSSCYRTFDQIDQVQNAVLQAIRIQAYLAFALTKQNPTQFMAGAKINPKDGDGKRSLKLEPGSLITLNPGEDVKTIAAAHPTQAFPENFKLNVRTLGLELGLPLELVLLDFSGSSYSSARAALLQAHRSFRTMQNILIARYLAPLYRWRVSKWMKTGDLARRDDAFNHRWIPTPWPYLDPIKEAQALQMQIDIGTQTIKGAIAAMGQDFETWVGDRGDEVERMRAAGIPLLHSASMQELTAPAATGNDNLAPGADAPGEEAKGDGGDDEPADDKEDGGDDE